MGEAPHAASRRRRPRNGGGGPAWCRKGPEDVEKNSPATRGPPRELFLNSFGVFWASKRARPSAAPRKGSGAAASPPLPPPPCGSILIPKDASNEHLFLRLPGWCPRRQGIMLHIFSGSFRPPGLRQKNSDPRAQDFSAGLRAQAAISEHQIRRLGPDFAEGLGNWNQSSSKTSRNT